MSKTLFYKRDIDWRHPSAFDTHSVQRFWLATQIKRSTTEPRKPLDFSTSGIEFACGKSENINTATSEDRFSIECCIKWHRPLPLSFNTPKKCLYMHDSIPIKNLAFAWMCLDLCSDTNARLMHLLLLCLTYTLHAAYFCNKCKMAQMVNIVSFATEVQTWK